MGTKATENRMPAETGPKSRCQPNLAFSLLDSKIPRARDDMQNAGYGAAAERCPRDRPLSRIFAPEEEVSPEA